MKNLLLASCLLFAGAVASAQTLAAAKKTAYRPPAPLHDLVHTVGVSAEFATLTKLIKAADLTNALAQAGPFTLFAPTDAAFQPLTALPDLLKPENKEQLAYVLKYHLVPGKLQAADLRDGQKLTTLNGDELIVTVINGKVSIDGAELVVPNQKAENGVIHTLNRVLLPGANLGNK